MTIEEEIEAEYRRQIELANVGSYPKERNVSQKVIDKRRKASKVARKARKRR